jgi:hypothetical protein
MNAVIGTETSLKQHIAVRWLSLDNAVQAIDICWQSLVAILGTNIKL